MLLMMKAFLLLVVMLVSVPMEARAGLIKGEFMGRSYDLMSPTKEMDEPKPLVLVLHGGDSDTKTFRKLTKFHIYAKDKGFVALFPQGIGKKAWNYNGDSKQSDDTMFLEQLVQYMVQTGVTTAKDVFIVGFSNGGLMAYRMLCLHPELFKAGAIVSATMLDGYDCPKAEVKPMLFFQGLEDYIMSYEGSELRHSEDKTKSFDATAKFWSEVNGCKQLQHDTLQRSSKPNDRTDVTKSFYLGCKAPIRYFTIGGGGHTWPGGKTSRIDSRINGPTTRIIRANREIWSFFEDPIDHGAKHKELNDYEEWMQIYYGR